MPLESLLLWFAILLLAGVASSLISDRFSVPVLLLYLAVGMLAGSEGIGGIAFDNAALAKSLGIVALVFIIFSGGLDTDWKETRRVAGPGILLSTIGVLLTAAITGALAVLVLGFSPLEGMLLGSIVSSTDAAAVFGVLRSRHINLARPLKPLLEFESGSNDPMAVFLTTGLISVMTVKGTSIAALVPRLLFDMGAGALVGLLMGRIIVLLLKRLKLAYQGLYPVAMVGLILLTYAAAVLLRGNGILAVYLAGLMVGHSEFPNKKLVMNFHDGVAWLMQIVMFVALGLLVFPSRLAPLVWPGLLLTLLLMVVARPLSVFLCLLPFKLNPRAKALVAWVGLRGSVPIILAMFPLMAGIPQADTMFNVVFFVVVASVFIQGTSIPLVARLLKLEVPAEPRTRYPLEFEKTDAIDADMKDLIIPYHSAAVGRTIAELDVPQSLLIVLIARAGSFIIPSGSTVIEGGDVLLVIANAADYAALHEKLVRLSPNAPAE
ncbi:potassium/proton antiporter [candidate division WOR-3 bacterium]|nr:potassium/proton antiporter [candidate division WOR-3 bacterium]